jgi:hypothetical protein
MRRWSARAALACSLAAGLGGPPDLAAQNTPRSGLWLEAARGTGTVRNSCSDCAHVTSAYGAANYLRAGVGLAGTRVLVGLELFALSSSDLNLVPGAPPVDAENGTVGPLVIWYFAGNGLYLRGGVGLSRGTYTVRTAIGDTVTTKRTGSALAFGTGFDLGVFRWLAVTADVGTTIASVGDVWVDGTLVDDIIATVYQASVGLALR